jgi:hypothetical protein
MQKARVKISVDFGIFKFRALFEYSGKQKQVKLPLFVEAVFALLSDRSWISYFSS